MTTAEKLRVLLVATHPVQYASSVFRLTARHPRLDILVAYCSLQGAEAGLDAEFEREVKWDVPLLDGYPWVQVPNRSPRPGLHGFWGLLNAGLWKMVRDRRFDAVVLLTGYRNASFWIAATAAKLAGCPVLFSTDAHEIGARDRRSWKVLAKRIAWPLVFRMVDVVLACSSGCVELMRALRLPAERVALTPNVVDNEWWITRCAQVDHASVRSTWGIPLEALVVLFCAKLQPWKRPMDLLQALARADIPGTYLVFAGDGPLLPALEAEARRLGWADRVRFLGFANQSELPGIYRASNLLVLPSDYEPFGLVVNEAMLCGCPVLVSDRVGARFDLVREGETGAVFPAGDVRALERLLEELLADPARLRQMGQKARARMETWSQRENLQGFLAALERAVPSAGRLHPEAVA